MSDMRYPPAKRRLKCDEKLCSMCQTCAAVCSLNKWGETSTSLGAMHLDINFYTADVVMNPCRQCVAPSCAAACPADAYYYDDERGCLVTDKEKCLGCGACAQACPVSAISYNRHLKKSSKCDLCGLCTRYCAADVLRIVEITKTGKEKQPALKEG